MNIILNTFDISTDAGAKVLRRCLRGRGFKLSAERILMAGIIVIMAKVILDQQKEIEDLEKESKKGD